MKRFVNVLIMITIILSLFCGCSAKESTNTEPSVLTVYVVQFEALYRTAVEEFSKNNPDIELNIEEFESYDEVSERFTTELMSGKGPDVLLFNSLYGSADPYKLSTGQVLLTLDEQVGELSDEKYYSSIIDAGKINGHQYFIPFSWNFLQAYSTVDTVEKKGYNDDLYTALSAEAEALENNDNFCASSLQLGRADAMNFFMEIAGNELIDIETGKIVEAKEAIKTTADYVKVFYDNFEKIGAISDKYRNDFAGAVSHYTYLLENYPFLNNLRYYQSVYPNYISEEMYFTPFSQRDSEDVTAQVIQYGAINANSENAEGAWKLLQYIMDAQVTMNYSKYETQNIYYAPVNVETYEACVKELSSEKGPGPKQKVDPLNEENARILSEIPSRISKSIIPNASLGEIIQECIEPYLLGTDSFDSCYEKLIQRVELYLNE